MQYGAQLSHHRRGADAVADHVAGHQRDPAVGADHGVEPVAAGGGVRGQEVPPRHVEARHHGQVGGQQGVLHHADQTGGDRLRGHPDHAADRAVIVSPGCDRPPVVRLRDAGAVGLVVQVEERAGEHVVGGLPQRAPDQVPVTEHRGGGVVACAHTLLRALHHEHGVPRLVEADQLAVRLGQTWILRHAHLRCAVLVPAGVPVARRIPESGFVGLPRSPYPLTGRTCRAG